MDQNFDLNVPFFKFFFLNFIVPAFYDLNSTSAKNVAYIRAIILNMYYLYRIVY